MNEEKKQVIAASKVTSEGIEAKIFSVEYMVMPNSTVTVCNITMNSGFSVRGESACVDPRNFDKATGQNLAYMDAFSKLWQLEGYLLAERRHEANPVRWSRDDKQTNLA